MNVKKAACRAAAVLIWLGVWQLAAVRLNIPWAVPTVDATAVSLVQLMGTSVFWQTLGASLLRITEGLLIGTAIAAVLAALALCSGFARAVISPAMTVIRCTPVASFIMVLWVIMGKHAVPSTIAVLMVCPVVWQSILDGYAGLDRELGEVLTVFRAPPMRRLRLLVLPGLRIPFLTGFVTAAGFAWKAGVAAEIIAFTTNSIGRQIRDMKDAYDGASMWAWTLCVVLMSLLLEKLIRFAAKRFVKGGS